MEINSRMKSLYLFAFLLTLGWLPAQVADFSAENCDGKQQGLHQILGSGKALVVASEGFDCSICQSKAAQLETRATNDSDLVVTWAAMTYTYSNQQPNCQELRRWDSVNGWETIFSFLDSTEYFFQFGTPRYLVYSPVDSSQIYAGGNEQQAYFLARQAAQQFLTQAEKPVLGDIFLHQQEGSVVLQGLPAKSGRLKVFNLAGNQVYQTELAQPVERIPWQGYPPGVYLFHLRYPDVVQTLKWTHQGGGR